MRIKKQNKEPVAVLVMYPASDPPGVERITGNSPVHVDIIPYSVNFNGGELGELDGSAYLIGSAMQLLLMNKEQQLKLLGSVLFMCEMYGTKISESTEYSNYTPYVYVTYEPGNDEDFDVTFNASLDMHPLSFNTHRLNTALVLDFHALFVKVAVYFTRVHKKLFPASMKKHEREEYVYQHLAKKIRYFWEHGFVPKGSIE